MKIKNNKLKIVFLFLVIFVLFFHAHTTHAAGTIKSTPSVGLEKGLVGYWNFDEGQGLTAHDYSGQANTGTLTNMTNQKNWMNGTTGLGTALQFDGVNDYVTFLNNAQNAVTISFWMKLNTSQNGAIIANGSDAFDSNQWDWSAYIFSNSLSFRGNPGQFGPTVSFTTGTWSHYVLVRSDGGNGKVYKDGALVVSDATIAGSGGTRTNFRITGLGATYFNGSIDEVRIYNRALSQAEITRLYNLKKTALQGADQTGMLGWWKLDEGSGTITNDSSGKRNNGLLTNIADPATATSGWGRGKNNKGMGLIFDGSNDYVDTGNNTLADNLSTMTVTFWFKTTQAHDSGTPRRIAFISKMTTGATGAGWQIRQGYTNDATPSAIDVLFQEDGGSNWLEKTTGTLTYNDGKWHHLAWTVTGGPGSGAIFIVYIDGVSRPLTDFSIGTFSSIATTQNVLMGKDGNSTAGSFYNGSLDDVRIYNRALSAAEITKIYKEKAGAKIGVAPNNNTLTQGLVGYWNFDGKNTGATYTTDSSGNGNTGTLTNGPIQTIGKIGQALKFDGVNDYVNIANESNFDFENTNQFSISAWFKTSTDSKKIIQKQVIGGSSQGYLIDLVSGNLRFYIRSTNTNLIDVRSNSGIAYLDNIWHQVTVTYNGSLAASGALIYVDGVSVPKTVIEDDLSTTILNNNNVSIGIADLGLSPFKGSIDEVRIYNRALSAAEVKRLYNEGR